MVPYIHICGGKWCPIYTFLDFTFFRKTKKKNNNRRRYARTKKNRSVGLSNKLQLQDIHFFDSRKTQNSVFEQKTAFKTLKRKINLNKMRFGPKAIIMSRSVKNMFYVRTPKKPSNLCFYVPEVSDLFFPPFFSFWKTMFCLKLSFWKRELRKITRSKIVSILLQNKTNKSQKKVNLETSKNNKRDRSSMTENCWHRKTLP